MVSPIAVAASSSNFVATAVRQAAMVTQVERFNPARRHPQDYSRPIRSPLRAVSNSLRAWRSARCAVALSPAAQAAHICLRYSLARAACWVKSAAPVKPRRSFVLFISRLAEPEHDLFSTFCDATYPVKADSMRMDSLLAPLDLSAARMPFPRTTMARAPRDSSHPPSR